MGKTRDGYLLVVAGILVFVGAIVVVRLISGGEETFARVRTVLAQNDYLVECFGHHSVTIEQNDGPWEVLRSSEGRRKGYYSVAVRTSEAAEDIKVWWRQLANGEIDVYAIYKTAPFRSDELLWGEAKPQPK